MPLPTAMMWLRALEAHASGLLAELGLNPMHPQLDPRHAELMRQRVMDAGGQLANHLVALGHLAQRDRVAALFRRLRILDHSERNDIGE